MRIQRFDAAGDAEAVGSCYEVYLAGAAVDDPAVPPMSVRGFSAWLTLGWGDDPIETWLARTGSGAVAGWYLIMPPRRENRHLARLDLVVHPSHRRSGLGSELIRHAADRARHWGRAVLAGDTKEGGAGEMFARALGARAGLAEIRRLLKFGSVPDGLRTEADLAAAGYELLCWEGPVPEVHLSGVAAVIAALADAPRDAGRELPIWDAGRIRSDERRREAHGLRHYTIAARPEASGELAGLTEAGVDPVWPEWAFQELTAVTRPHRGHRIGLLLKLAMLDRLAEREPQLKQIVTWNGAGNEHMIGINEKLGYEVLDRWRSFELEV